MPAHLPPLPLPAMPRRRRIAMNILRRAHREDNGDHRARLARVLLTTATRKPAGDTTTHGVDGRPESPQAHFLVAAAGGRGCVSRAAAWAHGAAQEAATENVRGLTLKPLQAPLPAAGRSETIASWPPPVGMAMVQSVV